MKPPSQPHLKLPAFLAFLAVAAFPSLVRSDQESGIDPEARTLAREVATKLQNANTIRLSARHKIDPAIGVGSKLEKGPLEITMQRPNRFHAIQQAGVETREIAFDGKVFCVMHPEARHHAMEPLRAGSIEQFADRVDERFGFRPPVAELLANDLVSTLFVHVTSATVTPNQWIWFTRCDRLRLEQPGMIVDLWINAKDRLPRRMLLTFTDLPGHPTWDIGLTKWQINPAVDESLFSKRPAADSTKVKMIKSR